MTNVCIASCESYETAQVRAALTEAIGAVGGLDFISPGMRVGIKANLVSAMEPDAGATTHPALLAELCRMIVDRGAEAIVGDSPGGLYNAAALHRVYRVCGLSAVTEAGGELNEDFNVRDVVFEGAHAVHSFTATEYLCRCDAIISFCKLKTHGMMEMSAAVKNLFGTIPGTLKPEYHFRFPDPAVFSDMLIDLNEYWKPQLFLCDAAIGMEGNGPTAGMPRKIGAVLASKSPYALDLCAARMIGLSPETVPTIRAAIARNLCPKDACELDVRGSAKDLSVPDFQKADGSVDLQFCRDSMFGHLFSGAARSLFSSRPQLAARDCIGCGKCAAICPAHAIQMKERRPQIDRSRCIRCFCCQEFCPEGAMRVHRSTVARLLQKRS